MNKPYVPTGVADMNWPSPPASGILRKGRYRYEILFGEALAKQIHDEATLRKWSFARMVRHLCEASISGIE